jgi:hypothetical protein
VFQTTTSPADTTFIYALNVDGSSWVSSPGSTISTNASALPRNLSNGTTAVAVSEQDNVAFVGSLSGTRAEILTRIGTASNWNGSDANYPVAVLKTSANAGWRMLSPPAADVTVNELMGLSLVQGIPGEYPTAQTNLFNGYNGSNSSANRGFAAPSGTGTTLTAGRGFIWYLFSGGGPAESDPNGQSVVSGLPLTLRSTAVGFNADVSTTFAASERSGLSDDGYFLLGNPFSRTFDLTGLSAKHSTLGTPVPLQGTFQMWNGSSYEVKTATADSPNTTGDDVTRWQGFWARATDPTVTAGIFDAGLGVTFTYAVASSNVVGAPLFYHKREEVNAQLSLHMAGRLASGALTRDEAAGFFFTDEATAGWDRYDASKLTPLSGAYATVAVWGVGPYSGRPEAKAQESLPLALRERVTYPLRLHTTDAGTFTLSWPILQNLPETWTLSLFDRTQGNTVNLRREPAYTFAAPTGTDSTRFTLTLDPGVSTAAGPSPQVPDMHVGNVYPNPARSDAQIRLRLGAQGFVTVSVFDVLGREVAVVMHGAASAGAHTLAIPTDVLTPGLYTLRVQAQDHFVTRRFAVAR